MGLAGAAMKIVTAAGVQEFAVRRLGLDSSAVDLTSIEALAASIRRAAGFMCPCGASTLKRAVARGLNGLVQDVEPLTASIESTLEAMIGFGDLIEQREPTVDGRPTNLLYPAHPSFVFNGNAVMIVGISPEHTSALTEDLEDRIEYSNHLRRLNVDPTEDLRATLKALGLLELTLETWLKMPPRSTLERMIARFDDLLDVAGPSGDIPDLSVIEPTQPVRYYRGRWTGAKGLTGRYVGRRPQAYGADLWCYIELRSGVPVRFVDMPLRGSRLRGCDEAWHLQMAIDARRQVPQEFRVRAGPAQSRILEFFSPLPMWAQRALDAAGEPTSSSGSLFAYRLRNDADRQVELLESALWLSRSS
jgi:hypothetical protein